MDGKLKSFIEYVLQYGQDENIELECRFGKYNKLTSNIKPATFFKIYNLFKHRIKLYKFTKDITIKDIRKRTTIEDSKGYVKTLFDTPDKTLEKIYDYVNVYSKLKGHPIYLTKNKIFKPIKYENVKIDLVMEIPTNQPIDKKPSYQKNKFRCTLKGAWNIDLTIILLTDCIINKSEVFFEVEIELNYKWITAKKLSYEQILNEFMELHKSILTTIECIRNNPLEVEMRYNILNQVVTLERDSLPTLTNALYSVTEKADGERFFIYIDNKKNVYKFNPTAIIKRKEKIFNCAKLSIYDTLIDGEVISINGKLTFLGFDVLYYNGRDCRSDNLVSRLNSLKKIISMLNQCRSDFVFKIKTFYTTNVFINASKIWNNRSKLFPYNLDGIIFTPIYGAYQSNLPIYKWKDKHSIDVRLLYNRKFDFTEFHPHGFPYTRKGSSEISNTFTDVQTGNVYYTKKVMTDNQGYKNMNLVNSRGVLGVHGKLPGAESIRNMAEIVEIEYDISIKKWVYLRKRLDKETPNAYRTVISVLDAIVGNITISEISKITHVKSPYELVLHKECYSDIGFKFINISINSPLCDFYSYAYSNILPKGNTILILGCDICVLKAASYKYKNIIVIEPNCLEVYATQLSEGYIGLKEYTKKNNINAHIIWGSLNISNGIKAYTKKGQTEIKEFIKSNIINTTFINSFADILFIDNKINKTTFSKIINVIKSISKQIIGIYLNGTQIIKYLEKHDCILTKNKELHPLYKIYMKRKLLNNLNNNDIFKIKQADLKLLEIRRMSQTFIPQFQPLLFDKNIKNIFKEFKLSISECKSLKSLYTAYRQTNTTLNDYDCIMMDITKYFKIEF